MKEVQEPIEGEVVASASPPSLRERVRSLKLPEKHAPRAGKSAWLPWTICALLTIVAICVAAVGLRTDKDYEEYLELKKTVGNPSEILSNQLKAQEAKAKTDPQRGPIALESKGYIIPISLVQISPKVGGMVLKLNVTEGMAVKKGFLLAKLEDVDYRADYDHAVAQADAAKR